MAVTSLMQELDSISVSCSTVRFDQSICVCTLALLWPKSILHISSAQLCSIIHLRLNEILHPVLFHKETVYLVGTGQGFSISEHYARYNLIMTPDLNPQDDEWIRLCHWKWEQAPRQRTQGKCCSEYCDPAKVPTHLLFEHLCIGALGE